MFPYNAWAPYPPAAPPVAPNPAYYYEDYWSRVQNWPGYSPYSPYPPSPTYMGATFVPLPPSPRITPPRSPRITPRTSPGMGVIPLPPPAQYPPYYDAYYMTPRQPPAQTHPLLNGENARYDLVVDLSQTTLKALTHTYPHRAAQVPVPDALLAQTATYPPTNRMTVVCPALEPFTEEWTINIERGWNLTVKDVLQAIHDSLRTPINHVEWARLADSYPISQAYTRRTRASDQVTNQAEARQGVRRVDFLVERNYFGGLVFFQDGDITKLKLLVKAQP